MSVERIRQGIRNALDEYGVTGPGCKVKFLGAEIGTEWGYDWALVTVDIYPPRKRKPRLKWYLAINMVREIVDWEKSFFKYYPIGQRENIKNYGEHARYWGV